MDIRVQTLDCDRCGQQHKIEIDYSKLSKAQVEGREPVLTNFICPNIALMYRVVSFVLDTRVSILKQSMLSGQHQMIADSLKEEWGGSDFDLKLKRFIDLDLAFIGIPEEYYKHLWPVVSAYCCGYFYPAMTSAGALGERILNRLIIKTRLYYKSSAHYKKIYNKESFDQWDLPIQILTEWRVISDKVADKFNILKKHRNDSTHYNDGYDFELNSHEAVKALAAIINLQFNYIQRKDLFWVFDVPGEIWLRSSKTNDPFVIEFILPNCIQLTPYCEPMATPPIKGVNTPLKPLSDEQFIESRNSRSKS